MKKILPLALAAMALVVTGCPHNEYIVELKPRGNTLERTLVFYREDGVNTNTGGPEYKPFPSDELAAITALYPAPGLTHDGQRYTARGEFTQKLPDDVGGAGAYSNLSTSLGEAGFYVERFRGNDDLAGMSERRDKAADQLADLIASWSQMALGREPGYDKLRQFIEVDFRRDLKNLGQYWWAGNLAGAYSTNADEEFTVRFGQYLFARGYFTLGDLPRLFAATSEDDPQPWLQLIQRQVARKMGVPETQSAPASLAFLNDESALEKSLDNYLVTTDFYRAKLKQWEEDKKEAPDTKKPDPSEVRGDALGLLVDFHPVRGEPDHLAVRLSLPFSPAQSNGRWDETLKQVIWETSIEDRTNASHLPFVCYASWSKADDSYQIQHFGQVVLTGDKLTQYCLWRSGQNEKAGREWDSFVASLRGGDGLAEKLAAFRFSDEPSRAGTNSQENVSSPSKYPRELLRVAAASRR